MNDGDREDFLKERRTGVGGSDIADVFSLAPWGCARKLWYQKRGIEPDNPRDMTGPMKRGLKLEAIVAEEYAEKTGRIIERAPLARHPEFPEWMCHRDFVTWGSVETPSPCIVDPGEAWLGPFAGPLSVKTANRQMFYEMKRQGLSDAYVLQLQSEMGVTGAQWGSYALLWADAWSLIWFDVKRDDALIGQIRDAVLDFWRMVQNGPAPERLDPSSPQCHRCEYANQCQGEAMVRLAQIQGVGTSRDASLEPLVREYREASEIVKEAQDYRDGVAAELKASMAGRPIVEVPMTGVMKPAKVYCKPTQEWDTTKLEKERPDIAAKYKREWALGALSNDHPELEKNFKRPSKNVYFRVYA